MTVQKSNGKIFSKETQEHEYFFAQLQHIPGSYSDTPGFFLRSFCCWTFANCINREGLTLLKTDIKEQKRMKKENTSLDNTVNDLRYEISLVIFGDMFLRFLRI